IPCILASISAVRPIMLDAFAEYLEAAGLWSKPVVMGTWPMCSTPPTMNTSPLPVMMAWAAVWMALMAEPHRRLTVWAADSCGIRVSREICRATLKPCSLVWFTQPQITSSTSFGSSLGLRSNSASISAADRVSARTLRKQPFLARPIGVRTQSTTTTSLGLRLIDLSPFGNLVRVSQRTSCQSWPFHAASRSARTAGQDLHTCLPVRRTCRRPCRRCSAGHHHGTEGNRYRRSGPYLHRPGLQQCCLPDSERSPGTEESSYGR